MIFPQYFKSDRKRYQSDGESTVSDVWYKMTEKVAINFVLGKYGQKSPSGGMQAGSGEKSDGLDFGPHRGGPHGMPPPHVSAA